MWICSSWKTRKSQNKALFITIDCYNSNLRGGGVNNLEPKNIGGITFAWVVVRRQNLSVLNFSWNGVWNLSSDHTPPVFLLSVGSLSCDEFLQNGCIYFRMSLHMQCMSMIFILCVFFCVLIAVRRSKCL